MRRRHPAKRDANEPRIIEALERNGCDVWKCEDPMPFDLLVAYLGRWHTFEVKNPEGRDKLTESQVTFFARCALCGYPAHVVRTPEDALKALGIVVYPGEGAP